MKAPIALALALCAGALPAQDLVAVKADKIVTRGALGTIQNAVILIENGKITQVGADIEVPWNAKVVDATGKVVLPTYVLAHSDGGMSGSNENLENVPYLTVLDAVDPSSQFFEECLRNGIGTIHVIPGNRTLIGGVGMVVRPFGKTVEDMAVRTTGGMKLSLYAQGSQMAQIQKMRRALEDAVAYRKDYERREAEFVKEKEAGATQQEEFEKPDELKKPTLDLLAGKIPGYLYVPSAAEIGEVERMLKEHPKLQLVLVLGPTCYKAADRIKALGLPVILEADALEYYETDPETGDETLVSPAKILADAGVDFALSVDTNTSSAERYPWWQMAALVRHGIDRQAALDSLTSRPAEILGIADECGSIEPGKVANLQILSGDPLEATSWVETVLLEGEVVYERQKDRRLQHLFGTDEDK